MPSENKFVFVVCGSSEHIQTLNFSLRYLRHFSKNEILVITDLKRNEEKIEHETIINIETPVQFNSHQASIYLKTSLHRYLPSGNNYCYLDTDVIALDKKVDEIFNYQTGIITFATDHCRMSKFSSDAVNCGCGESTKHNNLREVMEDYLKKHEPNRNISDSLLKEKGLRLQEKLDGLKKNRLNYIKLILKFHLNKDVFQLSEDEIYHKKNKNWTDKNGNIMRYDLDDFIKKTENELGVKWDAASKTWRTPDGNDIYQCNHLKEEILKKFRVDVTTHDFKHWNGGVFLFNNLSNDFLENWHEKSIEIFSDPYWKTRDQGTLISTVWEMKLENSITLPLEFNFIADYYHPDMVYKNDFTFDIENIKQNIKPHFIHIYRHWGLKSWNVWNDVESILGVVKK